MMDFMSVVGLIVSGVFLALVIIGSVGWSLEMISKWFKK